LIENGDGKLWLTMSNLDLLIDSKRLPVEVVESGIRVNKQTWGVRTASAVHKLCGESLKRCSHCCFLSMCSTA